MMARGVKGGIRYRKETDKRNFQKSKPPDAGANASSDASREASGRSSRLRFKDEDAGTASGQSGPKSKSGKFHETSQTAKPSDRIRQEDSGQTKEDSHAGETRTSREPDGKKQTSGKSDPLKRHRIKQTRQARN